MRGISTESLKLGLMQIPCQHRAIARVIASEMFCRSYTKQLHFCILRKSKWQESMVRRSNYVSHMIHIVEDPKDCHGKSRSSTEAARDT